MGIAIWLNEQAAREIYLRPWRYACSPMYGNAHGAMSSFNRVGNLWTSGSNALVNGILRGEFGFNGMIVTDMADANGTVYMSCVDGIMAGTDLWLSSGKDHSFAAYRQNATVVRAMPGSLQACAVQCGQLQRGHERLFCQYADCPRVHMVGDYAAEYAWRAWRADALSVGMLAKAYQKKK